MRLPSCIDRAPLIIDEHQEIEAKRLAAFLQETGQGRGPAGADRIAKGGGDGQRLDVLAGVFENAGEVLVGDCQVAIDLGDQQRVEFGVPAGNRDAKQQRQDDERRQKRDGQQPEADGARRRRLLAVGRISHSRLRICDRWSCAKCRGGGLLRRDCHRFLPARPGYAAARYHPGVSPEACCAAAASKIVREFAEDQRTFDQVSQLAHIARPGVAGKRRPHRCVDRHLRHAELLRQFLHEQIGQFLHVITPVAQRRQVELHDIDTVEQVGPEPAFLDLFLQVGIGGEDEAQVDRHLTLGADGPDAPVLDARAAACSA